MPVSRICAKCGAPFTPNRDHARFCSREHQAAFNALCAKEGKPLAPLVKAWNATRHAKPGTREAEICTFARSQLTEIARIFLDRDEEEGRDSVAYVGSLMDSGMLFVDRMKLVNGKPVNEKARRPEKAADFDLEALERLAEHFAGANDPVGQSIHAKAVALIATRKR